MNLLGESSPEKLIEGHLAVLNRDDNDAILYVVWKYDATNTTVSLVELDKPADGDVKEVNFKQENVYLLGCRDVLERVITWT